MRPQGWNPSICVRGKYIHRHRAARGDTGRDGRDVTAGQGTHEGSQRKTGPTNICYVRITIPNHQDRFLRKERLVHGFGDSGSGSGGSIGLARAQGGGNLSRSQRSRLQQVQWGRHWGRESQASVTTLLGKLPCKGALLAAQTRLDPPSSDLVIHE